MISNAWPVSIHPCLTRELIEMESKQNNHTCKHLARNAEVSKMPFLIYKSVFHPVGYDSVSERPRPIITSASNKRNAMERRSRDLHRDLSMMKKKKGTTKCGSFMLQGDTGGGTAWFYGKQGGGLTEVE